MLYEVITPAVVTVGSIHGGTKHNIIPDEVCETSYKDRGGKYQGQRGVTLPKT